HAVNVGSPIQASMDDAATCSTATFVCSPPGFLTVGLKNKGWAEMEKTSDFQIIAKAWQARFGSPMPVAGELEAAWTILKESGVDLPPPRPMPKPKPEGR